jgi:hypothetical protein
MMYVPLFSSRVHERAGHEHDRPRAAGTSG